MILLIRFRFLLGIFLLAILITFFWFWLSKIINQQGQDTQVINKAGQQQMLSQRIALLSYRIDKTVKLMLFTSCNNVRLPSNHILAEKQHNPP
jgi:nitrate/nitrite-specific signal transduction histidine kinase